MADRIRMLRIPANGVVEVVDVESDYRALAAVIGAEYVERVGLPLQGTSLILDEEGLLREHPLNPVTSLIFGHALVGDALLAAEGYVDDELDWIDCDPEDLLTRFGALVCAAAAAEVTR